jgi:phosphate transport system permease protein
MPSHRGNPLSQRIWEKTIEIALLLCGLLSILVTLAIAGVVIFGSVEFFTTENGHPMDFGSIVDRLYHFVADTEWTPDMTPRKFGILSLAAGTFMIAAIAALIAVPIGLATAIYLSEYATPRLRSVAKPTLELLAGVPSIVYGFFAIMVITPFLVGLNINGEPLIPGLQAPFNQLSGGIVVGIMIIPMVASLSEDALRAVPRSLRDGAYALGATKFEVSTKVVVPAGLSGITASFILAVSRAIGETMAVTLACGGQAKLTLDPREGIATMTSFIARISKGDIVHGSTEFNSLFAVAGLLFFMTLGMNLFAQRFLRRYRQVYQ